MSEEKQSVYQRAIYPVFARLDAEWSHDAVLRLLNMVERTPPVLRLVAALARVDDPRLAVNCFDIRFRNPLGIAAGLDKNAVAVRTWAALGWGHVEVGTITPQPQAGNLKPRIFRSPADRALINRMGFPGAGVAAAEQRLARRGAANIVVGVNIGANKGSVATGRAAADYVAALQRLHRYADYITINVSSPNTAKLRDLQGRAALHALVAEIVQQRAVIQPRTPLLLKIAPDLAPDELDAVLDVCADHAIDGLIATNTTIARPATLHQTFGAEAGGLSGAPLRASSTAVIRYLHENMRRPVPIIGVGGVFGAADVWDKLIAGAQLVQMYTGLIYEGPLLARRINRALVKLLDRQKLGSIAEIRAAATIA